MGLYDVSLGLDEENQFDTLLQEEDAVEPIDFPTLDNPSSIFVVVSPTVFPAVENQLPPL